MLKNIVLVMAILTCCFSAYADDDTGDKRCENDDLQTVEVKCEISSRIYEGKSHFAIKEITTTSKIATTGLEQAINTRTTILPYWPDLHKYGIKQLSELLKENKCEFDPTKLECLVITTSDNKEKLVIRKSQSEEDIFTISSKKENITFQQMTEDFKDTGICH